MKRHFIFPLFVAIALLASCSAPATTVAPTITLMPTSAIAPTLLAAGVEIVVLTNQRT